MMARPAFVDINLPALSHNLERLRQAAPKSRLVFMAKANAYGHGIIGLAPILHKADMVGTACLEEAIQLKNSGYLGPILLLEGCFDANELSVVEDNHWEIVVRCEQQISYLKKYTPKRNEKIKVWLKINTGMNRLGFDYQQTEQIYKKLSSIHHVDCSIIMTHFACADILDSPLTCLQIERFEEATVNLNMQTSLANSASLLGWKKGHGDWVRPGLAAYGISPFKDQTAEELGLKPVMTLHSQIIDIFECHRGESIGYGATFRCDQTTRVGVVAMGYADGYPQQAKNGTPVLVKGKQVDLIGRVSMDMLTINLNTVDDITIGTPVTLWGEGLPVEKIAESADTSPYELVCGLGSRLKRQLVLE
jgi:alanine racemase